MIEKGFLFPYGNKNLQVNVNVEKRCAKKRVSEGPFSDSGRVLAKIVLSLKNRRLEIGDENFIQIILIYACLW